MALAGVTATTYAGENAGEWIKAAIQSLTSFDHITVKDSIQSKRVVQTLANTATFVNDACDFTSNGTVTVAERILEPNRVMLNHQICADDFHADWMGIEQGTSVYAGAEIPPTFEEFLIASYMDEISSHIESQIWEGSGAAGGWTGFSALMAADAAVNDVAIPIALTATNIIAEVERLMDVAPSAVLDSKSESPKIYMNGTTARLYRRAMSALGYMDAFHAADVPLVFEGYEIGVCNGIADDKMYVAQPSNLWFGTNLLADTNEIKLLPQADIDGSKNINIVIRFGGGCQHGFGADIAAYNA